MLKRVLSTSSSFFFKKKSMMHAKEQKENAKWRGRFFESVQDESIDFTNLEKAQRSEF